MFFANIMLVFPLHLVASCAGNSLLDCVCLLAEMTPYTVECKNELSSGNLVIFRFFEYVLTGRDLSLIMAKKQSLIELVEVKCIETVELAFL